MLFPALDCEAKGIMQVLIVCIKPPTLIRGERGKKLCVCAGLLDISLKIGISA